MTSDVPSPVVDPPPKPKPRRGPGRKFVKGVSGNPGGFPKGERPRKLPTDTRPIVIVTIPELDAAFMSAAPQALTLLLKVMSNEDEDTPVRVRCAIAILDKVKPNAVQVSKDEERERTTAMEDFVAAMKARPPEDAATVTSGEGEGGEQ